MYNYHYLLDDLRWTGTTSVPDSSLGLNNGNLLGIVGLGLVASGTTNPLGWGIRRFLPTYCQEPACVAGPTLMRATSPRLRPELGQLVLSLSNQVDDTQIATTFFANRRTWTNELRRQFCLLEGLPGIRFFLPAEARSIHTMLRTTSLFQGLTTDGVTLRMHLEEAAIDPGGLPDRVDEGTLTTAVPGVTPFTCL